MSRHADWSQLDAAPEAKQFIERYERTMSRLPKTLRRYIDCGRKTSSARSSLVRLVHSLEHVQGSETVREAAVQRTLLVCALDADKLGGLPVQYREVQGHESDEFLKLFPTGVKIQAGGIDTGFKHVKPDESKPRLLHIKGTEKGVTATQVPMVAASLNSGDAFLLDTGLKLYQWNGRTAGLFEKNKAATLARAIDDEPGKPEVIVCEEGHDNDFPWDLLGGKPATIAAATSDDVLPGVHTLFKVSDASGTLEMTKVAEGNNNIKKSMLDKDDCFILDVVNTVYVWVGRGATADQKKHALGFAQTYLTNEKRPEWPPIARIFEGGENETFNSYLH